MTQTRRRRRKVHAEEVEKQPAGRATQPQRDARYAERQKAKGLMVSKVWVPRGMQDQVQEFAAQLREEAGIS